MDNATELRKALERWVKGKKKKAGKFWRKAGIKERIADTLDARAPQVAAALMDIAHDVAGDVLLEVFLELGRKISTEEKNAIKERLSRMDARLRDRVTAGLLDFIDRVF